MDCPAVARLVTLVMACFGSLSTVSAVVGQGHCALREPQKTVFEGFPEANGYRAVIRDVDRNERSLIDANMPFQVHYNEIGKHTLYVAMRDKRPIGIVHVRSEESRWGLVEIVWYLDLDLKVRRFRFQRVRSRRGPILEQSAFAKKLANRDLEALRSLLTKEGELADTARPVPKGADSLALTVTRSSLKTIIVTRAVWNEQIQALVDLELGLDLFPDGHATRRLVIDPEKPSPFAAENKPRHVETLRAVGVRDGRSRSLGTAVETRVRVGDQKLDLRWSLADDGRLLSVTCPLWPDQSVGASFKVLEGRVLESDPAHGSEAERAAAEVVKLVRGLVQQGER